MSDKHLWIEGKIRRLVFERPEQKAYPKAANYGQLYNLAVEEGAKLVLEAEQGNTPATPLTPDCEKELREMGFEKLDIGSYSWENIILPHCRLGIDMNWRIHLFSGGDRRLLSNIKTLEDIQELIRLLKS